MQRKTLLVVVAALGMVAYGAPASAVELVTNGNFSAGATGYQSTFAADGSGGGYAIITTNPNSIYGGFDSFGDHTTGAGNMLFLDPSQGTTTYFWQQTFNVLANSAYTVSYWARQAAGGPAATINAKINGVTLATDFTPPQGAWQQFTATYNSGANTSVTFSLFDTNSTNFYNDFVIDDISFTGPAAIAGVPEPATWALLILGFGAIGRIMRRGSHRSQRRIRFA